MKTIFIDEKKCITLPIFHCSFILLPLDQPPVEFSREVAVEEAFMTVVTSLGIDFRVIRKNGRLLIEHRRRPSGWEKFYQVPVDDVEDGEKIALRVAIRRLLRYVDDFEQTSFLTEFLSTEATKNGTSGPLDSIQSARRDTRLTVRLPNELKKKLRIDSERMALELGLDLTLTDYLIFRLNSTPES